MAILGPQDLPSIIQVRSEPMKHYCLSKLGYPGVDVEVTEAQFEACIKVFVNFIASYFPHEQRMAAFYTQPLVSLYPLPPDAWTVQDVFWDGGLSTYMNDIFSSEYFLFCAPSGTKLLTKAGPKPCEEVHEKNLKILTPFGYRKPKMRWNDSKQPISMMKTKRDFLAYTPNHPVNIESKFRIAALGQPGLHLLNNKDERCVIVDNKRLETDGTWSIDVSCGSYYSSVKGEEFYLVH